MSLKPNVAIIAHQYAENSQISHAVRENNKCTLSHLHQHCRLFADKVPIQAVVRL